MDSIVVFGGVRGYEKDGVAYLHIEDVARGLGFTYEATSSRNTVVRWNRVDEYLQGFGFVATRGDDKNSHDYYIPENIFYRLCMKAKNSVAEAFQVKVADEIIPSIRKTGAYSLVPQISEADTLMLQAFHCDDPLEYAGIMKRRDALVHKTELKRSMTAIGKLGGIQKARNIAIQERDKAKQALVQKQKELDTVQNLYDEYREHIGEGQKRMSSAQLKANYPDKFGSFKNPSSITRFLKRKNVPSELSDCPDKSGYPYAIFDVEKALEAIGKG